jgi:glycogen synthase (ADP-glucose)
MELCGWADDNKPLLVFVGRLVEQKGIDILLPALDWLLVEKLQNGPRGFRPSVLYGSNSVFC